MSSNIKQLEIKGKPGNWVAFSPDLRHIVAEAKTLRETAKRAEEKGEKRPTFAQVPASNCAFVL